MGILTNSIKGVMRNRWLSLATILVTTIVFTTSSFFIVLSIVAQRAVQVSQTKAQLQIYFQVDAPEEEVLALKDKIEEQPGLDQITYITKEEALAIYVSYYSDDPDLVESVSADWLPASLEVRAKTIEELEGITALVKEEKKTNPFIEDVQFHEDIVNQLKNLSKGINIAAIAIITIFSSITIALIVITIAFNIMAHRNEIEIMHLVGSSDSYIKFPFIIEGVFYTLIGSTLAATFLLVPWWLLMHYGIGTNIHFVLTDMLKELDLGFLRSFDLKFTAIFYGIHILAGVIIGFLSSSFAVMRNLKLKEPR